MKYLGVVRKSIYSPNCNDLAIMEMVKQQLVKQGEEVTLIREEDLTSYQPDNIDAIFSMARGKQALDYLDKLQQKGMLIINPPQSIYKCERESITQIIDRLGIALPYYQFITTHEEELDEIPTPCWIKRIGQCSMVADDVCYAEDVKSIKLHLRQFKQRGFDRVCINEHLSGDLVKFYGVLSEGFFFWCYPTQKNHKGKFGWETHNDSIQQFAFSEEKLQTACFTIAKEIQLEVFGGDCIIDSDGKFRIIDFNDWPSFNPCLQPAANAIAKQLYDSVHHSMILKI